MVDVGLTQVIVKRLNRWYRGRSQPHGTVDHFYRGTRLCYNTPYRVGSCLISLFLLSFGYLLYFGPDFFGDKSPAVVLAVKIAWLGIVAVAILAPLQTFREFAIVDDGGLMKSNLFGRKTRLEWGEISNLQIKLDENEIIFSKNPKTKIKMSLCYNGWQDFLEISAKHLNRGLHCQIALTLAGIKSART